MSENTAPTSDAPTNAADIYDHAISLIDTTIPQADSGEASRRTSRSPGWRKLAKRPTRTSVREGLARRKYAKWQEERNPTNDAGNTTDEDDAEVGPSMSRTASSQPLQTEGQEVLPQTDTSDFAARSDSPDRGRKRPGSKERKRPASETKEKHLHEVDILYENQRGMFFFGIPLYSHSSLLNFDPSAWVTKDLKDSAVNITNAQVPDPSWQWAWKHWYVDMSYDVDEEGWQYSFSFARTFAWHGTHPWFHSFVRRRRWLRQRVKRHSAINAKAGTMTAAHMLTADYFTIHSKRDRSPASTLDGEAMSKRASHITPRTATDINEAPEDVKNIPSLLKALKLAAVDREKVDAVKKFVEQGGEELVYLKEEIPEIMSFLVYQTSRRQLLEYLKKTASDAQKHRDEHVADDKPEDEAETRRIDNLLNAVRAANGQIQGLEYWSDRKHMLKTSDETDESQDAGKASTTFASSTRQDPLEENPVDVIKGISDEADVGVDPTKRVLSSPRDGQGTSSDDKQSGNGKERAGDGTEHSPENGDLPAKLPADSVVEKDVD